VNTTVVPAATCSSQTKVTGDGLTIATAGVSTQFTVTARDAFGNMRICSNDSVTADGSLVLPPFVFTIECASGVHVLAYSPRGSTSLNHVLHVRAHENDVVGSPFVTSLSAGHVSLKTSTISGPGLTLSTAGIGASFSITAKDAYGSINLDRTARFIFRDTTGSIHGLSTVGSNGIYTIAYTHTRSGVYAVGINVVECSGLVMSIYPYNDLASLLVQQQVSLVRFRGSPHLLQDGTTPFKARWEGLLWPDYAQTYSFMTIVNDHDDRVKLWIDTALIIDQWSSLSTLQPVASHTFFSASGYNISLLYGHVRNEAGLRLMWSSVAPTVVSMEIITSQHLSCIPQSVEIRSGALIVEPTPYTGSTAHGHILSIGTVGMTSSFTILAKDPYGNTPMSLVDFVAYLLPIGHSSRAVQSLVQLNSYFNYSGTLAIPFASGTYSLRVSQPVPSGLFATYYNGETLLTTHVSSRIDSSVDFSLAANAKPAVSLTTGSPYSVRWSGFVRPQYAQVYTFFAGVQTAVERMKLWVDNSLLVGQWTSYCPRLLFLGINCIRVTAHWHRRIL